eukprot:2396521-Prorocentrum_lima.AAC.1
MALRGHGSTTQHCEHTTRLRRGESSGLTCAKIQKRPNIWQPLASILAGNISRAELHLLLLLGH